VVGEQRQHSPALGLNTGGTGNYSLTKAPPDVRKAIIITNSGDQKCKLGLGMGGGALAPGAMGNLQDSIQSGMGSEGYPSRSKYARTLSCANSTRPIRAYS
jgi:hypothetical protein